METEKVAKQEKQVEQIERRKSGEPEQPEQPEKPERPEQKTGRAGIIVFIIGMVSLVVGAAFLLLNIFKAPDVRDAEYLVQTGAWQREDEPTVVWNFTEIGKGKLTTNFYLDEYDFIWAMEGDKLKIETEWLYTLDDEYTYALDQTAKTLTVTHGEESYTFVPAEALTSDENSSDETPTSQSSV